MSELVLEREGKKKDIERAIILYRKINTIFLLLNNRTFISSLLDNCFHFIRNIRRREFIAFQPILSIIWSFKYINIQKTKFYANKRNRWLNLFTFNRENRGNEETNRLSIDPQQHQSAIFLRQFHSINSTIITKTTV